MMKQFQEILAGNTKPTSGHQKQATNLGNNAHSFCGGGCSYQEGNSLGDGFQTRTICLEFPRFDGEDPETWCYQAAQFFNFYGTSDAQRLSISSFHMEGKALMWFKELKANKCVSNWEEFVRAMHIRFGKGSYDDPMETLTKLKQVGLLEDYKTQFDNLAIKVQRLPKSHKLSCFLGGLKDEIRLPVRTFNPKSLTDVYSLARIQEECVLNSKRIIRPAWNSNQFHHPNHGMSAEIPVGFSKGNGFTAKPRKYAESVKAESTVSIWGWIDREGQ